MATKRQPGSGDIPQDDNAKRAKADNCTELADIPTEVLHMILVEVVAMEVKNMKLAKRVWKEKADLVISRLGSVCSQWDSILTTNYFRMELHRALDAMADWDIHRHILRSCPIPIGALATASVGPDTFVLRNDPQFGYLLDVFCTNANTTTLTRDVIYLTGKCPETLVGCAQSGAAFLLVKDATGRSVIRIDRCGPHQFRFTTWLTGLQGLVKGMHISPPGLLLIVTNDVKHGLVLTTHSVTGDMVNQIMFDRTPTKITSINSACRKANGNFVLVACRKNKKEVQLLEIDSNGRTVRLYGLRLPHGSMASFADSNERIVVASGSDADLYLLDSEFNPLLFAGAKLPGTRCNDPHGVTMSSDGVELTSMIMNVGSCISFSLMFYIFTEVV